jgi:hypothetical protein
LRICPQNILASAIAGLMHNNRKISLWKTLKIIAYQIESYVIKPLTPPGDFSTHGFHLRFSHKQSTLSFFKNALHVCHPMVRHIIQFFRLPLFSSIQ